jgi:hypothetical protein
MENIDIKGKTKENTDKDCNGDQSTNLFISLDYNEV